MSDIAINPVTRRVQFTGNTGTGPYAFTFNVLQSSDIVVYKNNVLLTETTDYTVSIAANGTGNITMVVALVLTDILTIIGGRELSRTTDFVTAGDLLASSLNEQLDSNVIMSQQLDERFGRTLAVPPGDEDKTLALPLAADRADKVLTFDTEGNVQAQTASDLFGGAVLGGNFVVNTATGDGSTVEFGLTVSPGIKTNIQVYIDGVYQNKASFSISGTTLTFTEAPPLNSSIEFIVGKALTSITAGDASGQTYTQGATNSQQRTVESRLQDFVSVRDFGAVGDGATDDSTAIFNAAETQKYVYFPQGTYKVNQDKTLHSLKFFGAGGAIIKFGDAGRFAVDGTSGEAVVDTDGIIFEGPYNEAQYTDAVTGSEVSTAFDTPTYLDGSDSSYAGADFVHTKSTDTLTLNLSSLTGTTRRSVESDFITLNDTKKYVFHIEEGCFSDYASFQQIAIRTFNSSDVYLGDFDPAGNTTDISMSSVAKIKFRIVLQRTSDMPAANPTSTVIDLSKIRVFELTNRAATADLTDGSTHIQLGSSVTEAIFRNCVWRYMEKLPVSNATSKRLKFYNNRILRCWAGFGSTTSTESHFEGNKIDMRILHTDGSLYNNKFKRMKAIAGTSTENTTIINNYLVGSNWAIEFSPMTGYKAIVTNNQIFAEVCGISIPGGDNTIISENSIELNPGWCRYGIEIPSGHVDIDVSNNSITFLEPANSVGYGIGITGASTDYRRGNFSGNRIIAQTPMFLNNAGTASNTELSVLGNYLGYFAGGIFLQKLSGSIRGNVIERLHHMYSANNLPSALDVRSAPNATISGNKIYAALGFAVKLSSDDTQMTGNTIVTAFANPVLINMTATANHIVSDNVIAGIGTPAAYYSGSGGSRVSKGNRTEAGVPILLGATDEFYQYEISTTGNASLEHDATFTLPEAGHYIMSVRCRVGGDNNNLVATTFLVMVSDDLTNDMNSIQKIGTTAVSSGAPLVATATMTASMAISTKVITIQTTQSAGSAGASGLTTVGLQKFTRFA